MAFTYGKEQITKREYDLYIAISGGNIAGITGDIISDTQAVKIGVLADQPKITTEKGEDVALNTGAKVVISENISFEASLYEVTSANYSELRGLIGETVDIWLADGTPSVSAGTLVTAIGGQLVYIENMSIYPGLEIVGNAQNKINLSAELEAGVSSANVTISEG